MKYKRIKQSGVVAFFNPDKLPRGHIIFILACPACKPRSRSAELVEIRQLIKNVGEEKTVLLSTHIMQEVEAICDRVIIIDKGKIVLDSPLADLKKNQQQIIEVEFDYRIENVAFNELPNLEKVENPIDFRYHLYFDTERDMRGKVFDFAHDNGLKILQLHQKSMTLEKLFTTLTSKQG